MTIPTNLLQSQLALNKQVIRELHYYEQHHLDEARNHTEIGADIHYGAVKDLKKQIAKYALLQKAIKQALREAAYNAKYFPVACEDL